MFSTEELFTLGQALARDATLARKVAHALRMLCVLPGYVAWHNGLAQRDLYALEGASPAVTTLAQVGMVAAGRLQVRVNQVNGLIFVTDGVWWDASTRVFPFEDEAQMQLAQLHHLGWDKDLVSVLDLAGGCGHGAWAIGAPSGLMLDVNPRALAYAELNRALNALPPVRHLCALNDIRTGVPAQFISREKDLLVIANMPFGLTAFPGALPLTSDGGPSGTALQECTFEALEYILAVRSEAGRTRALVMGMTPGRADTNCWLLQDLAKQRFPDLNPQWQLCHDTLARINGKRALPNPSPLAEALTSLANCELYTSIEQRAATRDAYQLLADDHLAQGFTHLALGVVILESR